MGTSVLRQYVIIIVLIKNHVRTLGIHVVYFCSPGACWTSGFLAISSASVEMSVIFSYVFCISATLQGFLIFILMTARDANVRKFWMETFSRRKRQILGYTSNLSTGSIFTSKTTRTTKLATSSPVRRSVLVQANEEKIIAPMIDSNKPVEHDKHTPSPIEIHHVPNHDLLTNNTSSASNANHDPATSTDNSITPSNQTPKFTNNHDSYTRTETPPSSSNNKTPKFTVNITGLNTATRRFYATQEYARKSLYVDPATKPANQPTPTR